MCLQNMEISDQKDKKVEKNILELFWKLANKNAGKRIETCLSILRSLCKKQDQNKKGDDLSYDLKYSVERVVKGLSSSRDAARLGFAMLLIEILKKFPVVEIEHVLEHVKKHLAFTPNQDKRDVLFGQLFVYSSIIRSGRLVNHSHLSFVTLAIYDLWQGRSFILNACYQVFKDLYDQLSPETFAKELWPHLKSKFSNGWDKCSSDNLWLLLLSVRIFPEAVTEKFLRKHFNDVNIFCPENIDHLKKLIRQTTSCLPKLHPLCSEVSILTCNLKNIKDVWSTLVDDNLFEGEQTEKSFVGFEMVKCVLQATKKKKFIKCVLSPQLCSVFAKSLVNKKTPMYSASTQLAEYLSKYAIENNTPDIQMLILKFFSQPPGNMSLDLMLKNKEVASLIQNLHPDSVKAYCEFLKAIALKKKQKDELVQDYVPDARRFVAINQIGNLVAHAKMTADIEWRINVIKFLFLHAFFSIKSPTSEILHCEEEVEELSPSLRESCMNAFVKTLNSLYQRIEQQSPLQHSLQYFMLLVEYADQLLAANEALAPHFPIEKVQESWIQMKNIVHKLKKQTKKDGKVNETNAFLALFLELGFHLFHDYDHISEVLEELHVCCKKALSDRKHASEQSDETDEPPWVSVVTDILLSLLSRPSQHLRRLVTAVFQLLCPFVTKDALQQILAVINPEKDAEDPMLVEESDNEDLNFETGSSSGDSDDNLEKETNFMKPKKAQDNVSDDNSDEEESVILSDSEMMKLDDALAKAFRERVQTGPTKMKEEDKTMLEFRVKCLDLIAIYLKSEPPMNLVIYCVEPLLAAYQFSHGNEQQKHLLHKIVSVIETMTKIKKFQNLDGVEKSELKTLLEMLISKCHKEVNLEIAKKLYSLCVFVVLCFRKLEGNKTDKKKTKCPPYMKLYLSALEEFATGNNSHIYPQFFVSLMESCPDLAWYIIECQKYAFGKNIRMYRKTQCLGLLFEAIKFAKNQEAANGEQWVDLCNALIPVAVETLQETLNENDIKPVYLTELLDVIYVCHVSLKDKTNKSILEDYKDLVPSLCNLSGHERKRLGKKGKSTFRKIVMSLGGTIETKKHNSILTEENMDISNNVEIVTNSPQEKKKSKKKNKLSLEESIECSNQKENSVDKSPKRKSSSKGNKKKKQKTVDNENQS